MMRTRKGFLIYLAALVFVVFLLDLHFAASQEGSIPLRVRVKRSNIRVARLPGALNQRAYRIQLINTRTNAPLDKAGILVTTQPRDFGRIEGTVSASELFNEPGTYLALVPFSRDGDWLLRIVMFSPVATQVAFADKIRGEDLGPTIPMLETEGESVGESALRTLASGYAFLAHLGATATLGLALALMFMASRNRSAPSGETATWGTHLFWASLIVLVSTGVYNFVYHTISPAPLPLTLNMTETWWQLSLSNYGDAYAVILAAKHLAILALIGVGAAITWAWRTAHAANSAERAQKLRVIASAVAVILGTIILLLGGALVYLHAISEH